MITVYFGIGMNGLVPKERALKRHKLYPISDYTQVLQNDILAWFIHEITPPLGSDEKIQSFLYHFYDVLILLHQMQSDKREFLSHLGHQS